eukprot:tig00000970_g5840.t1
MEADAWTAALQAFALKVPDWALHTPAGTPNNDYRYRTSQYEEEPQLLVPSILTREEALAETSKAEAAVNGKPVVERRVSASTPTGAPASQPVASAPAPAQEPRAASPQAPSPVPAALASAPSPPAKPATTAPEAVESAAPPLQTSPRTAAAPAQAPAPAAPAPAPPPVPSEAALGSPREKQEPRGPSPRTISAPPPLPPRSATFPAQAGPPPLPRVASTGPGPSSASPAPTQTAPPLPARQSPPPLPPSRSMPPPPAAALGAAALAPTPAPAPAPAPTPALAAAPTAASAAAPAIDTEHAPAPVPHSPHPPPLLQPPPRHSQARPAPPPPPPLGRLRRRGGGGAAGALAVTQQELVHIVFGQNRVVQKYLCVGEARPVCLLSKVPPGEAPGPLRLAFAPGAAAAPELVSRKGSVLRYRVGPAHRPVPLYLMVGWRVEGPAAELVLQYAPPKGFPHALADLAFTVPLPAPATSCALAPEPPAASAAIDGATALLRAPPLAPGAAPGKLVARFELASEPASGAVPPVKASFVLRDALLSGVELRAFAGDAPLNVLRQTKAGEYRAETAP